MQSPRLPILDPAQGRDESALYEQDQKILSGLAHDNHLDDPADDSVDPELEENFPHARRSPGSFYPGKFYLPENGNFHTPLEGWRDESGAAENNGLEAELAALQQENTRGRGDSSPAGDHDPSSQSPPPPYGTPRDLWGYVSSPGEEFATPAENSRGPRRRARRRSASRPSCVRPSTLAMPRRSSVEGDRDESSSVVVPSHPPRRSSTGNSSADAESSSRKKIVEETADAAGNCSTSSSLLRERERASFGGLFRRPASTETQDVLPERGNHRNADADVSPLIEDTPKFKGDKFCNDVVATSESNGTRRSAPGKKHDEANTKFSKELAPEVSAQEVFSRCVRAAEKVAIPLLVQLAFVFFVYLSFQLAAFFFASGSARFCDGGSILPDQRRVRFGQQASQRATTSRSSDWQEEGSSSDHRVKANNSTVGGIPVKDCVACPLHGSCDGGAVVCAEPYRLHGLACVEDGALLARTAEYAKEVEEHLARLKGAKQCSNPDGKGREGSEGDDMLTRDRVRALLEDFDWNLARDFDEAAFDYLLTATSSSLRRSPVSFAPPASLRRSGTVWWSDRTLVPGWCVAQGVVIAAAPRVFGGLLLACCCWFLYRRWRAQENLRLRHRETLGQLKYLVEANTRVTPKLDGLTFDDLLSASCMPEEQVF